MRRNEQNLNPTLDSAQQKERNVKHIKKLQQTKPLINAKPNESPSRMKDQNDYNIRQRKEVFDQSEYLLNLIPSDQNRQKPSTPKSKDNLEGNKIINKNNTPKTINESRNSSPPSALFVTEKDPQLVNQKFTRDGLINYFDYDQESYSLVNNNKTTRNQGDNENSQIPNYKSRLTKQERLRRLREARDFNSHYYKPERLNQFPGQFYDEDLDELLHRYTQSGSSESDSSIEIEDDVSIKSKNSTKPKKLPTLNSTSEYIIPTSQIESDFVDFSSLPPMSKQKKQKKENQQQVKQVPKEENPDDSTSEFFFSEDAAKKSNSTSPVDILLEIHDNQSETNQKSADNDVDNNQQITDSFVSTSDSEEEEEPQQFIKRYIRVKKKRIIRRRVPKKRNQVMIPMDLTFQYAVARSVNGRPLYFHVLKGNEPIPSNSAIVQIDATRRIIVRANERLEITQNVHYDSFPPNSIIVLPNQNELLKQYPSKAGGLPQPQVSPYVVTNLEDTPPHFIFIPPDEDLPPDAYLIARDSRIRIAIQGNLMLRRIVVGQQLPPNSIRVLSSITQPRRTVCIVQQNKSGNVDEDESEFHLITVRNGEEFRLPDHSIIVNRGKYTKTAIVSSRLKPLKYLSFPEGSNLPKNAIVISSNVLRNKPPKMAVTTSKQITDYLSFSTVKNQPNAIPMNSIVIKNDEHNILAIVPFNDNNKLSLIQINENEKLPNNVLPINFENDFLISSVVATSSSHLNIGTTYALDEYPKHSIVLKQNTNSTISLFAPDSSPLKAVPTTSKYSSDNSYLIENTKDSNIIAAVPSNKSLFDILTLKSVNEIPQNSIIYSHEEMKDNDQSRVATIVPSNGQNLCAIKINAKDINEALSKLPEQSLLLDTSNKTTLYQNADFCVNSPDGKPLSVITISKDEEIPQNSILVKSFDDFNLVAVSSNGDPLRFNALYNKEQVPANSLILSKKGTVIDPNEKNDRFTITARSNNNNPLKLISLNNEDSEKCPQNSIPIKRTDNGIIIAVSEDGGPIHLEAIPKGENIPANSIEIPSEDNKTENLMYLTTDDSTPLQFITTDSDSKLPSNSIIINKEDNQITAVHSNKPIQLKTMNQNEEIPKNAILFDITNQNNNSDLENQKIAYVTSTKEPLRIITLKATDDLPENAKIIKKDKRTVVAVVSPDNQPLLLSTFNSIDEIPQNSFFIDPNCENFKAAVFSSNGQLDLKTIVDEDEITNDSLIIQTDKESAVCLFAPENETLSIISLKEDEKEPENSYIITGKSVSSLFVPSKLPKKNQDLSSENECSDDEFILDKGIKEQTRLIIESSNGELLNFITLPVNEKQPPNSIPIPNADGLPFVSYVVSPNGCPLKLVSPVSYDNGEHENAVDISSPENFYVSSPNGANMNIVAIGNNQSIPTNSAIISYDDKTFNVVIGDPYLQVSTLKEKNIAPNSIQPMFSNKNLDQTETRIAVFADKNKPFYLLTLNPNKQTPLNSIQIMQDTEKVVYLVSTDNNPINCRILDSKDEIPNHSFIFQRKGKQMIPINQNARFAIFAENQSRLVFMTINKGIDIPLNSFIVDGDNNYNRIILSPSETPLFVYVLSENEEPIPNSFAYYQNDKAIDHFSSYIVASADDSQLHIIMTKEGEKLPNNSMILSNENSRITAISTPFNSRNLLLYSNSDKDIPKNSISFNSKDRNFAVASTSQQPLAYTILRNGGSIPRNAFVLNKEGGINGRSLAVYAGEGQRLVYCPINGENTTLPPNAIIVSNEINENEQNKVQLAVRSADGKPMKFLIVNSDDEIPENEVTLLEEANGRKVVLQDSNAKPLQYFLIPNSESLPKNSVIVPTGNKPIEKIVVVSSKSMQTSFTTAQSSPRSTATANESPRSTATANESPRSTPAANESPKSAANQNESPGSATNQNESPGSTTNQNESSEMQKDENCDNNESNDETVLSNNMTQNQNENASVVSENDEIPEPLQFVVLKPGEEVLPTSAVVITEGGRKPRRLAVKSPKGYSLKYIPLHEGEPQPPNSITVCKYPLLNATYELNKSESNGIFNISDKAMIAVASVDFEKPFQYIIVKHGDRMPRSALELFKEGGDTPRTVSIISQNEKVSPLSYFFVNPGCELPAHSLFVDTNEINKSISIIPESGSDAQFDIVELDINEEIPPNSIVVAIKDNKKIILKTNDDSPLKAVLTKPGREPKNCFILNTPCDDEHNSQNHLNLFEQIENIKMKMAKRNGILNDAIEEEEEPQENQLENTLSQVLTALNLSISQNSTGSPKTRRKKKLVKRRKKKKELEIEENELNEEEEKLAKLLLLEENEKLLSSCIGEPFTDVADDNSDIENSDNDLRNEDNKMRNGDNDLENSDNDLINGDTGLKNSNSDLRDSDNDSKNESQSQSSISLQAVNSNPPFERIFAPSAISLSIPLTFEIPNEMIETETMIEEEEEDRSDTAIRINHRLSSDPDPNAVPSPNNVSHRRLPLNSLIMTEEELRQCFLESPLKIGNENDRETIMSGRRSGALSSRLLNLSSRLVNEIDTYRSFADDDNIPQNTDDDMEFGLHPINKDLDDKSQYIPSQRMLGLNRLDVTLRNSAINSPHRSHSPHKKSTPSSPTNPIVNSVNFI